MSASCFHFRECYDSITLSAILLFLLETSPETVGVFFRHRLKEQPRIGTVVISLRVILKAVLHLILPLRQDSEVAMHHDLIFGNGFYVIAFVIRR